MISRLEFFKKIAAGAALMILGGPDAEAEKKDKSRGNPYEYNIDEFRKIDPSLLLYKESESLPFREEPLKGIAAGVGDVLAAAGSGHIYIYGKNGSLKNKFKTGGEPNCITLDEEGKVLAGMMDHVEIFSADGVKLAAWNTLGEKAHITSIAAGREQTVVADYGNGRLWVFSKSGKLLRFISRGFAVPSPYFSVKFDGAGNIWAVNPGRLRVEQYTPEGEYVKAWGRATMEIEGFSGCCNPTHLAIDAGGNFFTSEKGIPRVKKYDSSGSFLGIVAGPDKFREGARGLDLAVDTSGIVYVADPANKKVKVFAPSNKGAGK